MTRGRRWPLVLIGLVAVGVLVGASLQGTMTFYRTPSEITSAAVGDRVRVGGTVLPGSMVRENGVLQFRLTDGVREVVVRQGIDLPGEVREGQQAVVEGVVDGRGVLHADTVMNKHGNSYEATPGASRPGARDGS